MTMDPKMPKGEGAWDDLLRPCAVRRAPFRPLARGRPLPKDAGEPLSCLIREAEAGKLLCRCLPKTPRRLCHQVHLAFEIATGLAGAKMHAQGDPFPQAQGALVGVGDKPRGLFAHQQSHNGSIFLFYLASYTRHVQALAQSQPRPVQDHPEISRRHSQDLTGLGTPQAVNLAQGEGLRVA